MAQQLSSPSGLTKIDSLPLGAVLVGRSPTAPPAAGASAPGSTGGEVLEPPTAPLTAGRAISVDIDGKHVLLPITGPDGRTLSDQEAIQRYQQTHQHWGIYATTAAAVAAAQRMASSPAPTTDTGPLGWMGTAAQGASDLAAGAYEAQPIHPLAIGQAASDVAGPAGLAVHDALTGGSNPQQFAETATRGVRQFLGNMGQAQGQLAQQAQEAFAQGDYVTGGRKAVEYLIPILGPILSKAGDDAAKGQVMRGIGEALGASLNLLPAGRSPALAERVGGLAESPLGKTAAGPVLPQAPVDRLGSEMDATLQPPRGTQAVPGGQPMPGTLFARPPDGQPHSAAPATAAAFADANQIPIDVGTRTGQPVASATREINARTGLLANVIDRSMVRRYTARMQAVGDRLLALIHPEAVTPISGGEKAIDVLERLQRTYRQQQQAAYGKVEAMAADPRAQQMVTVEEGQPPIPIAFPVDIRPALASLRAVRARLARDWFVGRQGVLLTGKQARALAALDTMLEAPGIVPAIDLDKWLSQLKAAARNDGGVLREVVGQLETRLQAAVRVEDPPPPPLDKTGTFEEQLIRLAQRRQDEQARRPVESHRGYGDPLNEVEYGEALDIALPPPHAGLAEALADGRAATKAKVEVQRLLDRLAGAEQTPTGIQRDPYRLSTRLTAARDAHIMDLRALAAAAPEAVPPLGRGLVQQMLDRAFHEPGRLDKAAALYGEWQRLGPQTKEVLFGADTGRQIGEFFRLAAQMAQTTNPSGTAYVGALVAKGAEELAFVLQHPLLGAIAIPLTEIGQAQLARMLWTPGGAALMTKALKLRMTSAPASMAVAAELVNAARAAGVVIAAADKAAQGPPPGQPDAPAEGGGPAPQRSQAPVGGPEAQQRQPPPNLGPATAPPVTDAGTTAPPPAGAQMRGVPPTAQPLRPAPPRTYPAGAGTWYGTARATPGLQGAVTDIVGPDAYQQQIVDPNRPGVAGLPFTAEVGPLTEQRLREGKRPFEIQAEVQGSIGHDINLGPPQTIGPYTVREVRPPAVSAAAAPGKRISTPPTLKIGGWEDAVRQDPKYARLVKEILGPDAYTQEFLDPTSGLPRPEWTRNVGLVAERLLRAGKRPGEVLTYIRGRRSQDRALP